VPSSWGAFDLSSAAVAPVHVYAPSLAGLARHCFFEFPKSASFTAIVANEAVCPFNVAMRDSVPCADTPNGSCLVYDLATFFFRAPNLSIRVFRDLSTYSRKMDRTIGVI
jgi:hypothetical protein